MNLHESAHAYIHKLNEFTGFVQRPSLSGGLKNNTVFIMKPTGFLLFSVQSRVMETAYAKFVTRVTEGT